MAKAVQHIKTQNSIVNQQRDLEGFGALSLPACLLGSTFLILPVSRSFKQQHDYCLLLDSLIANHAETKNRKQWTWDLVTCLEP